MIVLWSCTFVVYYFLKELLRVLVVVGQFGVVVAFVGVFVRMILAMFNLVPQLLPFLPRSGTDCPEVRVTDCLP